MTWLWLVYLAAVLAVTAAHAYGDTHGIRLPFERQRRSIHASHRASRIRGGLEKRIDAALLTLAYETAYMINVTIGTPGQSFQVLLDTGSGDLWVPSQACPVSMCPGARFDASASSTFKNNSQPFDAYYGDMNTTGTPSPAGFAIGSYVTDVVSIAGATVPNQLFGLVSSSNLLYSEGLQYGILGLGYPGITASAIAGKTQHNTFIFNLFQNKAIPQPIFALSLGQGSNDMGEITLGATDSSKYTGQIQYIPVQPIGYGNASSDPYGYWTVPAYGISMSGRNMTPIVFNEPSSLDIVPFVGFDTGSSLTYLDPGIAKTLAYTVDPGAQYNTDYSIYLINCNVATSGINITFTFSNLDGNNTIWNGDTRVNITTPISQLVLSSQVLLGEALPTCVFGIAPTDALWFIGDPILSSAYIVYDFGQHRIGIADALTNSTISPNVTASSVGATDGVISGFTRTQVTPSAAQASHGHAYGANVALIAVAGCLVMILATML